MDQQLFEMMQQRFDGFDAKLDEIKANQAQHANDDREYWLKIDQQEAQISLLMKLVGGIPFVGGLAVWLWNRH